MIDDLARARWQKDDRPGAHRPRVAVEQALAEIEEWGAQHAIVIFGRENEDGTIVFHSKQAGSFGPFAQKGLVAEVLEGWNDG